MEINEKSETMHQFNSQNSERVIFDGKYGFILGLTALCILLRRLAYPNRLCDMVPMFHLSTQSCHKS
ncbi:unnamed protein product [Acanthoscelides obtectus]|uniref:Uncharacterized protein n=1 Tax=Acanthoscelides obtectus TaxID=200917 RepID=A0A9P0VU86_ACAOB|nr:unnamed protein product [Acanthoscelides obtectus]CAK1682920.1 hypothetical protein AOBTE_LOCUS33991 [Acanthoscelides obtectus]